MSQPSLASAAATHAPASRGALGPIPAKRPPLQVAAIGRPATSRFLIASLALACLALIAILVLNTVMASGSYRLSALQEQAATLTEQQQQLSQQVVTASAPSALARRAGSLGMVPAPNAAFIRLSDGALLGVARAAPATGQPSLGAAVPAVQRTNKGATRVAPATASNPQPRNAPAPIVKRQLSKAGNHTAGKTSQRTASTTKSRASAAR